jgi:hypothetical protein
MATKKVSLKSGIWFRNAPTKLWFKKSKGKIDAIAISGELYTPLQIGRAHV